jgi:hypothetical protein
VRLGPDGERDRITDLYRRRARPAAVYEHLLDDALLDDALAVFESGLGIAPPDGAEAGIRPGSA